MKKLITIFFLCTSLACFSQGNMRGGSIGGTFKMNGYWFNSGTGAHGLPHGTTAQRPGSPNIGDLRLNTDSTSGNLIEIWSGSAWVNFGRNSGGGGSGTVGPGTTNRYAIFKTSSTIGDGLINDSLGSINIYKDFIIANDGENYNNQWLQLSHNQSSHKITLSVINPYNGNGFQWTRDSSNLQTGISCMGTTGVLNFTGWSDVNFTISSSFNFSVSTQIKTTGDGAGIYFGSRDASGDFIQFANANNFNFYSLTTGNAFMKFHKSAPANSLILNSAGNLLLANLATGGTAPTTSGTTKMVITDANGQVSFANIPSSGSVSAGNNLRLSGDNVSDKDTVSSLKTFTISPIIKAVALGTTANKVFVHRSDSTFGQVDITPLISQVAHDSIVANSNIQYQRSVTTTDATITTLDTLIIDNGYFRTYTIAIHAENSTNNEVLQKEMLATVKNNGGTYTLIGTVQVVGSQVAETSLTTATVTVAVVSGVPVIRVTGVIATNIKWYNTSVVTKTTALTAL